MIEYLRAWIFANKERNKKNMEFFNDQKALEYVETIVESTDKLIKTGFLQKTDDGNFVLAELANAQVEVRELKKELEIAKNLLKEFENRNEKNVEIQN